VRFIGTVAHLGFGMKLPFLPTYRRRGRRGRKFVRAKRVEIKARPIVVMPERWD
jgi:hypothetical protein